MYSLKVEAKMDSDFFIADEERIILDLHDMQEAEAKFYLEKLKK